MFRAASRGPALVLVSVVMEQFVSFRYEISSFNP